VSRNLKAHILLVFVTLIWGTTFVVIKDVVSEPAPGVPAPISALLFNAVRMSLAAAVLWIWYRKHMRDLTRGAVLMGTVVGIFLWLGYEFQTTGIRLTTAAKSGLLTGVSVVLVPVFLAIFFRRKINRWTSLGVVLALAGLYLLTVPAGENGFSFSTINRGDLLTMACAVAFAFQIIFLGRATQHHRFEQIATLQATVCALLMAVTIPIADRPHVVWSGPVISAILITGLLGTALAFTVQAWAQQFTPPTHTALIFALEPVFAWLTSYVVLQERLGYRAGSGAVLILAGVLTSELMGGPESAENEAEVGDRTEGLRNGTPTNP
jgi:drug/metabolite transporter (DMT)-like permease